MILARHLLASTCGSMSADVPHGGNDPESFASLLPQTASRELWWLKNSASRTVHGRNQNREKPRDERLRCRALFGLHLSDIPGQIVNAHAPQILIPRNLREDRSP